MMIVRLLIFGCLFVLGCEARPPAAPDARPVDSAESCPPPPDAASPPSFFGEACVEGPAPAVTFCHADRGWCVAGVCRPQCNSTGCRRCDAGSFMISDRGACYCAP